MALTTGQTFKLGSGIKTGVAPGQSQYGVGAGQSVKILGSRNVGGQQYYDIQHIGGGTGWTLGSALQKATAARPKAKAKAKPRPSLGPTAAQLNRSQAIETSRILSPYRGAMGEYEEALGGMEKPLDIYTGFEQKEGITERQTAVERLRKQTDEITQMLDDLEENVTQRMSGVLSTSAQRGRVVAAEAAPLGETLGTVGAELGREETALGEARGRVGTLTSMALAGQEQGLRPLQARLENLRYTMSTELDSLRDRLTRKYGAAQADMLMRQAEREASIAFNRQKELLAIEHQNALARQRATATSGSAAIDWLRGQLEGGGGTQRARTAATTDPFKQQPLQLGPPSNLLKGLSGLTLGGGGTSSSGGLGGFSLSPGATMPQLGGFGQFNLAGLRL